MPFSFEETPESRAQTYNTGLNHILTRIYKAVGEQDDITVGEYAIANLPDTQPTLVGLLFFKEIRVKPDGFQQYFVEVDYAPPSLANIPRGSYTFSFNTTGGTGNIKCGKGHIASYYVTSGPSNPHKGAIGVTQDGGVEGVDIVVPALKFSLAFKYPTGTITVAFVKTLAAITGSTNQFRFLGYNPGELLFMGASGTDGTEQKMEVTFDFEASQNATGLTVGGISGVAKNGHEYGWEEFGDAVDTGKGVVNATAVHIERVYDQADFASVFQWNIFTG